MPYELKYKIDGYPESVNVEYRKIRSAIYKNGLGHLFTPADQNVLIALSVAKVQYNELVDLRFKSPNLNLGEMMMLDDNINKIAIRIASLAKQCYLTPVSRATKSDATPKEEVVNNPLEQMVEDEDADK